MTANPPAGRILVRRVDDDDVLPVQAGEAAASMMRATFGFGEAKPEQALRFVAEREKRRSGSGAAPVQRMRPGLRELGAVGVVGVSSQHGFGGYSRRPAVGYARRQVEDSYGHMR